VTKSASEEPKNLKSVHKIVINTVLALLTVATLVSAETQANTPPEFNAVSPQTAPEGADFSLRITASDLDGDPISIMAISRPSVSSFVDNGNGTADLLWNPDYLGPNSSDGSPFSLLFLASDGMSSDQLQVVINVLNSNRNPVINSIGAVEYVAGDMVSITISGADPDSDPLTWRLLTAPTEVSFSSGISALIDWQTVYADSGLYDISVELADSYGARDTVDFDLRILPKSIYELSIDIVSAFPGEIVDMGVNLMNLEEVSGFNLLINYDISALILTKLTDIGTRAESFEYFNYSLNNDNIKGDIQIIGIANIDNGVVTENLLEGEGPLANFSFYVTNDLTFSGYSVPVTFAFRNLITNSDNTLTDPLGGMIAQEAINYSNGYIAIQQVDISGLGDINLNGVTFEIADAIYFINFFIDPGDFPLGPEQRANTDVNRDGLTASVADLVYFMNYLLNPDGNSSKLRVPSDPVEVLTSTSAGNFNISTNSDIELGGLAITLESNELIDSRIINIANIDGMTVKSAVDGNLLRLLIYSENGRSIPSGLNNIFTIKNDNQLTINKIELSSADGVPLKTAIDNSSHVIVPDGFKLNQNYPNPFNPATEISFSLPKLSKVNLTVYNVLGQEVRTLIETSLPSGNYSVVWDGRNGQGISVSSGIYFYMLKADEFEAKRKMLLMK